MPNPIPDKEDKKINPGEELKKLKKHLKNLIVKRKEMDREFSDKLKELKRQTEENEK